MPGDAQPGRSSPVCSRAAEEGGLGYTGLIVTDGMEMQAISGTYGIERGSVLAIAAGADAICVGGGLADEETVLRLRDALVRAVHDGELPEQRLADAAARVRALAAGRAAAAADGAGRAEARPRARRRHRPRRRPPRPARHRRGGPYEPLTEPPYVAAFTPVGEHRRGRRDPLGRRRRTGTPAARHRTTATYGSAGRDGRPAHPPWSQVCSAAAADRRIVAVVRDVHRHPWMADALDALLAARPDTVVVEMGVPPGAAGGVLHIATHGAARVCGRAAAEVITGKGADG